MKTVSVVVPIYNVERYIDQCVSSILKQTYKALEVILVDDGSTDTSKSKCDDYAKLDKRVKVLHKTNEGQSVAREAGVKISTGEYIAFVDGDDWLDHTMIEKMYTLQENTDADIVICGNTRVFAYRNVETHLFDSTCVFSEPECRTIHRRLIGQVGSELHDPSKLDRLVTMWGKLYRRSRVENGIWVSERVTGTSEDTIFNIGAFEKCKRIAYLDEALYFYRRTNVNSTTMKYISDLEGKWNRIYEIVDDYLSKNSFPNEYYIALENRIALQSLGLVLNETVSPENNLSRVKRIRTLLSNPRRRAALQALEMASMPPHWRLFYSCAKHRCAILILIAGNAIQLIRLRKK